MRVLPLRPVRPDTWVVVIVVEADEAASRLGFLTSPLHRHTVALAADVTIGVGEQSAGIVGRIFITNSTVSSLNKKPLTFGLTQDIS